MCHHHLVFMPLFVFQNGEVLSTSYDIVMQKSRSILKLKITPADNQAELCCESANVIFTSPLSITRKITVLCKFKTTQNIFCSAETHIYRHRELVELADYGLIHIWTQ